MIAAQETVDTVRSIPVPVVVAMIGLFGTLAVAALTAAVAKLGESTERRREGYAQAVRNLVRWIEYPYRIRRRTSDAPETLAALAAEGHSIQEDLRCSETWVTADKAWAGALFRQVRKNLGASVGQACTEAWESPPVTSAADMNLNGFGPAGAADELLRFEQAVRFRFGLRRLGAPFKKIRSRPQPEPEASG